MEEPAGAGALPWAFFLSRLAGALITDCYTGKDAPP